MITLRSDAKRTPPPEWAMAERHLIRTMNEATPLFQARYTRADGSFIWRSVWPGFDGSDDGYESYHNWPLFYALGGDADLYSRSRFLWEAVTQQFTQYGQIWREYDANYDWMHHGESSLYFYYFGLCEPANAIDIGRTRRFAALYDGSDAAAPNFDAVRKQMRSPITGSRGPRTANEWEDWSTHRAILANYPAPFGDIPGVARDANGAWPVADWNDNTVYREILRLLNERQMSGDVPLNLTATSLMTHAFTLTGDDKYRQWVVDYLEAWAERIEKNGGLCPDNIGPNGVIGENMGGKWWGGYYGWQWPHGFMTILQPLLIAAMNASLLTGDLTYLDIPRGQLDKIVGLGREEIGRWLVPHKHTDDGWTAYRPLSPEFPLQLAYFSQDKRDFDRLEQFPERLTTWREVAPGRGKGDDIHIAPWHCFLQGQNPDYPTRILAAQWEEMARRMERMRHDNGDPETWDVHHWQEINPVHTEALIQLTLGSPQVIYHGGLLHVPLRYFDATARRPGLPPDVGALVSEVTGDALTVTLSNLSPLHERKLIVQAGAFAEHEWTDARSGGDSDNVQSVQSPHLRVELLPGASLTLRLGRKRFVHRPSYEQPLWIILLLALFCNMARVGAQSAPFVDPAPPTVQTAANVPVPKPQKQPELTFRAAPKPLVAGVVTNEWRDFLGPTHNGISPETNLLKTFGKGDPAIVWEVTKGEGYASPCVVGNSVLLFHRIANQEIIERLHAENGRRFWKFAYPTAYSDRYGFDGGPRCQPISDGERVYTYGAEGKLHCLDLITGQILWKRDIARDFKTPQEFFGVGAIPLIEGDKIIVNVGAPGGPCVAAFDKKTGKMMWGAGREWGPSYASPIPATVQEKRRVFVFAGGESRPSVGGLLCLDPATGKADFTFSHRARRYESVNASSPLVIGNQIFISECYGPGGALLTLQPDGSYQKVWSDAPLRTHFMTAIHKDGYLYGIDGHGPGNAPLVCIELKTGKEMWRTEPEWEETISTPDGSRKANLSPGLASMLLVADGRCLLQGYYGHLAWLDLNPKGYRELSRALPFFAPQTWSPPALSRGLLYVCQNERGGDGSRPRLICYDFRAKAVP